MANIKSAKKRIKSSKKKASHNLYHITRVKKLLKQIARKLSANPEEKKELYAKLQKFTDKAVAKKSISSSKGSKIKSRVKKKLGR